MPHKVMVLRFYKGKKLPGGVTGAAKICGIPAGDLANRGTVVKSLKRGVPYAAVSRLQKASRLSLETISQATQISPRTLARRKIEGRLSGLESERFFRLTHLFEKAVNYHEGDIDAARAWLELPKPALGNETPLAMAESELGAKEVEDLLDRLEYGVYS